jgi:murein DD-endopeptidase MepM/ murein hydrolase activator NlpD
MKNLILLRQSIDGTTSFNLAEPHIRNRLLAALAAVVLLIAGLGGLIGYWLADSGQPAESLRLTQLQSRLQDRERELQALKGKVQHDVDAMAVQLGKLYAQALKLNSLGGRLTAVAKLDDGEFDFSVTPGIGGAEPVLLDEENTPMDVFADFLSLQKTLNEQEKQFALLSELMDEQQMDKQLKPSGKPVESGWISSSFGKRTDPFTGKPAFHSGIDFSAHEGTGIKAAADGVVIWAGKNGGYGNLVEIDHGNGYVTRYAHNSQILVKVGDKVKAGQRISRMGKTGRATASHLHFEVLKNGRKINPWPFIHRA